MRTLVIVSLAALAFGCGKKDDNNKKPAGDGDGEGTAAGTGEAKEPPPEAPDFGMWKGDEKMKAWQGSWLVKENGTIQAWTVSGTEVESWDGQKDATFTLEMAAPCRAYFKGDGGMKFPRNFTAVDGQLRFRSGGAGYRDGDKAIYCDASGSIYTLAGGTCTLWEDDFGKWKKKAGDCGIKKNAEGAEVFHHADPNGGDFAIEGGAILSKASFETEKVDGDHAAARAARDKEAAE